MYKSIYRFSAHSKEACSCVTWCIIVNKDRSFLVYLVTYMQTHTHTQTYIESCLFHATAIGTSARIYSSVVTLKKQSVSQSGVTPYAVPLRQ